VERARKNTQNNNKKMRKHLDSPKMNEEQAINLITKHFPIAIQAFIQTTKENKFYLYGKIIKITKRNQSNKMKTQ